MILLNATTLELKEFFPPRLPPYSILSHTWEEEEVILQDLHNPDSAAKKGFEKIRNCCAVSLEDGHNWVWIDTCCIDKTSSAELSEAINSMFRYYQEAEVCYAYLSDLPPQDRLQLDHEAFKSSRWFTRGWTLQELIAPKNVVFYDQNWTEIGTKSDLREAVQDVTSIRDGVLLHTTSPMALSIAERMSWAAKRLTTREEDIAYCLLGILNINMPLLYGEGPRAFIRLQIEFLRTSEDPTIFLWSLEQSPLSTNESSKCGVLAPNPSAFGSINVVNIQGNPTSALNRDWRAIKVAKDPLAPLHDLRGPSWRLGEPHVPAPPAITSRGLHIELILIVLPKQPEKYYVWTGCLWIAPLNSTRGTPQTCYLCIELSPNDHEFRVGANCLLAIPRNEKVAYARLWDLYLATESSPYKLYIENNDDSENADFKLRRVRAKPQPSTY